ncbi:hypothetical protein J6590_086276 [Homalodisca vitripennis]|nr:hypothetical protein J6590_086276 [Homalodisca vitripennis]
MKSFPKKALWFSRIFGSLPLEYSYGTSGIETLKFSITGFISGLTLFLLQVALSGITMFLAVTEKIEEYPLVSLDSVSKLTIIVYSITLQVTAAVVFLCFVWNYFRFVDICKTLYWVHCRLYNKAPEIKDRINAIVVSIVTGIILITLTYLYNINHVETLTSTISSSPVILLYFTQVGLYVHFTYVTQSIASGFRMVSTRVKEETTRNIIEQMFVNQIPPNDETASLTREYYIRLVFCLLSNVATRRVNF